jgi:hypothetical protein
MEEYRSVTDLLVSTGKTDEVAYMGWRGFDPSNVWPLDIVEAKLEMAVGRKADVRSKIRIVHDRDDGIRAGFLNE